MKLHCLTLNNEQQRAKLLFKNSPNETMSTSQNENVETDKLDENPTQKTLSDAEDILNSANETLRYAERYKFILFNEKRNERAEKRAGSNPKRLERIERRSRRRVRRMSDLTHAKRDIRDKLGLNTDRPRMRRFMKAGEIELKNSKNEFENYKMHREDPSSDQKETSRKESNLVFSTMNNLKELKNDTDVLIKMADSKGYTLIKKRLMSLSKEYLRVALEIQQELKRVKSKEIELANEIIQELT